MPALDHCEPQVLRALYKQGWYVVDKPLPLRVEQGQRYLFADARLQNVNTQEAVIIIEIKCFANPRILMDDLYSAIGQYLVYLNGLQLNNVTDSLFLTMPHPIYAQFQQDKLISFTLKHAKLNIITIDIEAEEVISWITY